MTQVEYFVIKVESCTQSEKIIDAEDKIGDEVLHSVQLYLDGVLCVAKDETSSISCAEGFVVISFGKVDFDKSGCRDD
jgi:hypothetical protein